jgi:delta 1-pyrroline-5-carboxylate dehydrogenase
MRRSGPRCCAARPIFMRRMRARSWRSSAREAGKTLPDAVGELREAVDFLRYYAAGPKA